MHLPLQAIFSNIVIGKVANSFERTVQSTDKKNLGKHGYVHWQLLHH